MYAYGVYNIHISSSFIILILRQLCGCLVLCPYVQKYASSSVLWFSFSSSWVCTPHMEHAGLFWTCWIRQLAYFQLNIEMCLPSYFPLSNVWIINVPENREQSKQLCEDLSHFLIFYFRLNVSWTLFEQRPEKTTHTPASGSDSCWSITPKTKRVKLNMSARSSWFLYCWLELELKKNTRTVLPQQPAFISWSDVSWHKADMMKM